MFIKNQKGLVILETIPIIWVMFVLMGATLGSWGIVHTATLNSIAARNYIFFIFNNRADLSYLRDFSQQEYPGTPLAMDTSRKYFRGKGKRFSYINKENVSSGDSTEYATRRRVSFGDNLQTDIVNNRTNLLTPSDHNRVYNQVSSGGRNKKRVHKAWIMVGYGICLCANCDSRCGD